MALGWQRRHESQSLRDEEDGGAGHAGRGAAVGQRLAAEVRAAGGQPAPVLHAADCAHQRIDFLAGMSNNDNV